MELSEYQLTAVVQAAAELRDPQMGEKDKAYQASLKMDTVELIMPLLNRLPQGVTSDQLLNYDRTIQQTAVELLVKRVKRVQVYRDAPEAFIIANLSQEQVFQVSRQLYLLASVAIDAIPRDQALENLLAHFEDMDLDAELAKLTEDEDPA